MVYVVKMLTWLIRKDLLLDTALTNYKAAATVIILAKLSFKKTMLKGLTIMTDRP